MTKSRISPCLILLALAAIVPFGSAVESGLSETFTQYSAYYESEMQSQVHQVYNKLETHAKAMAEKIDYAGYAGSAADIPVVRSAIECGQKKLAMIKKHLTQFAQFFIRLVSYARALKIEIETCFSSASVAGAPKLPTCIVDVTGKVAQASIIYQQKLVLDAVKLFVAVTNLPTSFKNCALYNQ